MHISFSSVVLLVMTISFSSTTAFEDNCEGSWASLRSHLKDCEFGLKGIDTNAMYTDQQEFSPGHCMIKYRTGGAGPQPVSGQIIRDTAFRILTTCRNLHGSFGTANCDGCHVTVNYRDD